MLRDEITKEPVSQLATDRAAHVTDGVSGIARNRWCNVVHNTLPTSAGTGTATYLSPGVRGLAIESLYLVAGPVPLTTTNWRIRYAINSPSDATAAAWLPVAEPSHGVDIDIAQVFSFNATPILIPDTEGVGDLRVILLTLPTPIIIDVLTPITRLDFVHNLGAGVTIQLGIRALEGL